MKSIINKILLTAIATLAIYALPVTSRGDESVKPMRPMKGAEMLTMRPIATTAEAEALKPGDSIAMVCVKCKTTMIHNVTTEKGHIQVMSVGSKHMCAGCNSTITVVGTGKGKHDAVKHTCDKCGDDSVFCCANKPGTGATKGMEKKD